LPYYRPAVSIFGPSGLNSACGLDCRPAASIIGFSGFNSTIAAVDFHRYMDDKVAGVRASTDGAASPQYTTAPPGCSLHQFNQLTTDDVVAAVRQLPDKQSATDPMPTHF